MTESVTSRSTCAICGEKYKPHDNNHHKSYCLVCAVTSEKFHDLASEYKDLPPEKEYDDRRCQIRHRMGELNIVLRTPSKMNQA